MTIRERNAHLLRRFAMGATLDELAFYEGKSLDEVLGHLLDFEREETAFPVSPYSFFLNADGNLNGQPQRAVAWWTVNMCVTDRPALDRLNLFWHDHFAVSAEKVKSGVIMLYHLETMRKHGHGKFRDLLGAMTVDPAMLVWLDGAQNIKGTPNENYGRELLELFTMGEGKYTETDVLEASRALTGWGYRTLFVQGQGNEENKRQIFGAALKGQQLVVPAFSKSLFDDGEKTILGKTANFDTDSLLDLLCERDETVDYVTTKLWEFYAYDDPEEKVKRRLARVWKETDGDIKSLLVAIAASDEFWSDRCVRKRIKSPVDFVIAIVRQLDRKEVWLADREPDAPIDTPAGNTLISTGNALNTFMSQQGMALLYPPDVAGWNWGEGWITTATMLERIKLSTLLTGPNSSNGTLDSLRESFAASGKEATAESIVDHVIEKFDAEVDDERKALIVVAFENAGGVSAMSDNAAAKRALTPVITALFAMPEFHLC
ncbi:MAG: DUF1800 domain-containing protein [Armatimonadetes bacterium]|nr:DUF1800 domain-containing protein [Armatimonadota bacterium]